MKVYEVIRDLDLPEGEAIIQLIEANIELTYRTAFADGMERIMAIMQKSNGATVDQGYARFRETL